MGVHVRQLVHHRAAAEELAEEHALEREFIDYTTSMITDEDPLRGLLFY